MTASPHFNTLSFPPPNLEKIAEGVLIDSHAHLAAPDFAGDLDTVIRNSVSWGVQKIISIGSGYGVDAIEQTLAISDNHPCVYSTIGIHPHEAGLIQDKAAYEGALQKIERLLATRTKIIAIGEIGLDYHYAFASRSDQLTCFEDQLNIARTHRLPVIIHSREAFDDTLKLLEQKTDPTTPIIMHCFSGGQDIVKRFQHLNCYISFSGILTFPKALASMEAAKAVALDHLLIETDAPFLAPAPYRGKRNEPALVIKTAEKLAEVLGLTLTEICNITTQNTMTAFRLNPLESPPSKERDR